MKKIILFVFSLISITIFVSSCNDQKTAQELIQEEKKAIQRFVTKNGIKTLASYPENGVFAEDEYYRNPDGLYINVVDSGNGRRAVLGKSEICVRFGGVQWFKSDTISYSSYVTNENYPYTFTYGNTYSYDGYYSCAGWALPLAYIGENAVVNLIIPSNLGSTYDQSSYRPVFYKKLKYTRID
ncbi:MAG: DUF4827 domain-containing protein [Dysgonamonadaceae bacterium]|jgi:hypothetical protein|nr:DUF4827 domain-containing protein [Dysgonamonadaceae bacterium]